MLSCCQDPSSEYELGAAAKCRQKGGMERGTYYVGLSAGIELDSKTQVWMGRFQSQSHDIVLVWFDWLL
jgi:hypothetical protein